MSLIVNAKKKKKSQMTPPSHPVFSVIVEHENSHSILDTPKLALKFCFLYRKYGKVIDLFGLLSIFSLKSLP